MGCNRTDLESGFHAHLGCTYRHFLNGARVRVAQDLLATTAWRMQEVAKAAGYASKASFCFNFRQFCGFMPKEYRRRWQPVLVTRGHASAAESEPGLSDLNWSRVADGAQLRDPQAIPALAEALGTGFTAIRAVAGFGQAAAPTVIGIVRSATSTHYAVDDGLITLRFMVEGTATRPLSDATLQAIRQAAHQRLTGKQYFTTLWSAIDLAVVLSDRSLTRIVEALATDWNEVVARGKEDPELIERTQKLAAERLAGSPPLPRPDPSGPRGSTDVP